MESERRGRDGWGPGKQEEGEQQGKARRGPARVTTEDGICRCAGNLCMDRRVSGASRSFIGLPPSQVLPPALHRGAARKQGARAGPRGAGCWARAWAGRWTRGQRGRSDDDVPQPAGLGSWLRILPLRLAYDLQHSFRPLDNVEWDRR